MTRALADTPARRAVAEVPIRRTVADLLASLGGIPADRVRLHPTPGTATEQDVLDVLDHENIPCEIVDGVLVEKAMGFHEASLNGILLYYMNAFLIKRNLGIMAGADGTLKLTTGLLRIPDVSFISWDRLPDRKRPTEPIPQLAIDLAVEVLSKSNTKAEMTRKVREYFEAGTLLVWLIDPKTRTARVFTSVKKSVLLKEDGTLDGGAVLPGFTLSLRELFAQANRGADD